MMPPLPPPADLRRIRHLRLRAADPADVRAAVPLLEDALRTASIPGAEGGRLVFIRHLDLGRIPRHASAATIALQVEHALGVAAWQAVPFDAPGADQAGAVTFPGPAEALATLVRRLRDGPPPNAWFWPRLVPAVSPQATPAENWIRILDTASTSEGPAPTLAAVVAELARDHAFGAFLAAVPPEGLRTWWERSGIAPPPSSLPRGAPAGPPPRLPAALAHVLPSLLAAGASPEAMAWAGTFLALHEEPARAADRHLPARVLAWLGSSVSVLSRPRSSDPDDVPESHDGTTGRTGNTFPLVRSQQPQSPASAPPSASVPPPASAPRTGHADGSAPAPLAQPPEPTPSREKESPYPLFPDSISPLRTEGGGLLLLLPLLGRLGLGPWLEANPAYLEAGFAARLLCEIGRRTGLARRDPLLRLLAGWWQDAPLPPPAAYPAPVTELLATPPPRGRTDTATAVWLAALRRWCRRHARLGLFDLVRRPARLTASTTHLELTFDHSQVDLRLRREALDLDPGWVPWLGRVVIFHYTALHELRR